MLSNNGNLSVLVNPKLVARSRGTLTLSWYISKTDENQNENDRSSIAKIVSVRLEACMRGLINDWSTY
jgi:hypothetical protein